MTSMNDELKPCPHCGRSNATTTLVPMLPPGGTGIAVRCGDCGASGPPVGLTEKYSLEGAVAAWNCRAAVESTESQR